MVKNIPDDAPDEGDFIFDQEEFVMPGFIRNAVDEVNMSEFIWRGKNGFLYLVQLEPPHGIRKSRLRTPLVWGSDTCGKERFSRHAQVKRKKIYAAKSQGRKVMEFEGNLNPIHGVRIHVIGVGGCGINAIEHMIASGLPGASFITADTNVAALARSQAEHTIQLGPTCCMGLGTNGDPNLGRRAAEESLPAIKAAIDGADMIFVVAGMGCGGTGTGAAPVIAKAAKDTGALTIGVVTKPFAFEGTKTLQRAEAGTQAFLYSVDSLIAIPNDSQLQFAPKKTPEILKKANEALYQALKCVSDMVTQGGLIGLDFAEVRAVLGGSGMIAIGIGTASSEHRAKTAAMRALDCSLLGDAHIGDLRGVLYSITASSADLSGDEIQKVATVIGDAVHEDADICFQVFCDNSMGDEMRVTLIGTFGTGMMTRQPGHSYSPLDGKLG